MHEAINLQQHGSLEPKCNIVHTCFSCKCVVHSKLGSTLGGVGSSSTLLLAHRFSSAHSSVPSAVLLEPSEHCLFRGVGDFSCNNYVCVCLCVCVCVYV